MRVRVPCQLVQCAVTETRPGGGGTWSFHDVYSRGMNLAESQSGRGHGQICNLLIIRAHLQSSVSDMIKKSSH